MKNIIEALADSGVILDKGWAFCPFHTDTGRPNFKVYPETNSWYCFSCNIGGDAVAFLAKMQNTTRSVILERMQTPETVMEELSQSIEGLMALEEPLTLNHECNIAVSKICRQHLQKYPEKSAFVLKFLRKFDNELFKTLQFEDLRRLVAEAQKLPETFV